MTPDDFLVNLSEEGEESCASLDKHCPHTVTRVGIKHGKYVPVNDYISVFRCCQCGWWSVGTEGWTKSKPPIWLEK